MRFRKKDYVRCSGYISYVIEYKCMFWWCRYQSFINRIQRENYFENLINKQ